MIPTVLFVALSETGKTTLMEGVIRALRARGYRVLAVKHTRHSIDVDKRGSDSWRFCQAGAEITIAMSPERSAAFMPGTKGMGLEEVLERFADQADIALVEGDKEGRYPKIEVHRGQDSPGLFWGPGRKPDPLLIAVASDVQCDAGVPCLSLGDHVQIADFVERRYLIKVHV